MPSCLIFCRRRAWLSVALNVAPGTENGSVEMLGTVLHRLQNDSSSSLEPWTPSWRDRRGGYYEYVYNMKQAVGLLRRDVLPTASKHWDAADMQTKSAWGFVHFLRSYLYNSGEKFGALSVRTRIPLPAGVIMPESPDVSAAGAATAKAAAIGKGIGIMRIFNTDWHNEIQN